MARRIVLGTNYEAATLLGTSVDGLDNIDQFLFILQHPVELVIIPSSKITHDMFVPEEKHNGAWIIKLIHLVEVRDAINVANVDDGKAFNFLRNLVQHLVLAHAVRIPVAAEADDDESIFLTEDGLVDVPSRDEVGDDDGAHG